MVQLTMGHTQARTCSNFNYFWDAPHLYRAVSATHQCIYEKCMEKFALKDRDLHAFGDSLRRVFGHFRYKLRMIAYLNETIQASCSTPTIKCTGLRQISKTSEMHCLILSWCTWGPFIEVLIQSLPDSIWLNHYLNSLDWVYHDTWSFRSSFCFNLRTIRFLAGELGLMWGRMLLAHF